jgi:hypothetical protein
VSAVDGATDLSLPGSPPRALTAFYGGLSPVSQSALRAHLLGGTSAEWLAKALTEEGYRISASTIRTYRRSLQ